MAKFIVRCSVRSLLLAVGVLLVSVPSADAVDHTDFLLENAKQLGALCEANTNPAAIHMCEGFLVGVHRVHESIGEALGTHLYCFPKDGSITRDTAARDFAAWVRATPAAATMPPAEGALQWASLTYPCR
jgi:hypothetical protein